MRIKETSILLIAFLCTATCWDLWAQTPEITFELVSDSLLELTSRTPAINQGDQFMVVISNVTSDQPSWAFSLGSESMERIPPTDDEPLKFLIRSIPESLSGATKLTFTDTNDVVKPSNPSIVITIGTEQTTSGQTRTIPASIRNTYNRTQNIIKLYFDESGFPYRGNIPTDIDDNDVIEIYLVAPKDDIPQLSVTVTGSFASDDFSIQGAGALGDLRNLLGTIQGTGDAPSELTVVPAGTYGPFTPPSITIAINKDGKELRSYSTKINKTYLASLRLAVGQSTIRFNEYDVKPFAGSTVPQIKNVSSDNGELRYYLTVVFYGWQLGSLDFWNGRDLNETPPLLARINPYVGVGLKDVGEEFLIGLSLELARGLDFIWGMHAARTEQLNGGFSEGDTFTDTASELPTKEDWEFDPRFLGVSVDLRVATQVLGTLFGQ